MDVLPTTPWSVEAVAATPDALIELRRYDLPRPSELWEIDDDPIFSVTSPRPGGARGTVQYEAAASSAHEIGAMMLRPGKVRMHSIGEGGVLTVLRCRFDHNTFAAMTALSDWDARRLRQCAALRSKSLMALARRVQREVAAPGFSSEIAIAAYADLMMIEIGRLFHDRREPKARGGLAPWQLARIDEMMRAAHGAWPNVGEMAAACGVSRSHLSRAFAQATGVTLAAHAEALRLERAKALMGRSGVSMSAVAAELGFATPSAFGAAFRRATGQSPLRYARLLRRQ